MTLTDVPTVLVPGLACSARLWDTLMPTAWARGATTIADTRRDTTLGGIADRLLANAPDTFAGISMGGYICLEVVRRAPQRVRALALISTTAAPDTVAQTQSRTRQIELARDGKYDDLVAAAFPSMVDERNLADKDLAQLWTTMARQAAE